MIANTFLADGGGGDCLFHKVKNPFMERLVSGRISLSLIIIMVRSLNVAPNVKAMMAILVCISS